MTVRSDTHVFYEQCVEAIRNELTDPSDGFIAKAYVRALLHQHDVAQAKLEAVRSWRLDYCSPGSLGGTELGVILDMQLAEPPP